MSFVKTRTKIEIALLDRINLLWRHLPVWDAEIAYAVRQVFSLSK